MGGEGIEPFINLIEGGRDGQTYQDMRDFFYYSMIRSKDENTTKTRKLDGTVPLEELPNLMRAMGHYPTEQEIENMKDEVKFSTFAETGQYVVSFDLDTFIRLFVNHRPVYGIGKPHIEKAFTTFLAGDKQLLSETLIAKMMREGDQISVQDLQKYLYILTGEDNFKNAMPEYIAPDEFAQKVLGFEEIEEDDDLGEGEEEEEEDDSMPKGKHVAFNLQDSPES